MSFPASSAGLGTGLERRGLAPVGLHSGVPPLVPSQLALSERGQEVKVKHSRNSHAQLGPARQALAMVHTLADDFSREVARLCQVEVTPSKWEAFLDAHVPRVHTATGLPLTGRSQTMADTKRDSLTTLYRADPVHSPARCSRAANRAAPSVAVRV